MTATEVSAPEKDRQQSWPVYAAAAGSSLALATAVGAGTIVYSGPQNVTLNMVGGTVTAPINIDGVGGAELALRAFHSQTFSDGRNNLSLGTAGLGNPGQFLLNGSNQVRRLASGVAISAGAGAFGGGNRALNRFDTFGGTGTTAGTWPFPATAFAGLNFQIAGQTHYGWIRLALSRANGIGSDGPDRLVAIDWAYDDTPNDAILAGATTSVAPVPEPSGLLMLATGFVGVLAWRRHRNKQDAPTQ